jgi:hypothetical protein
MGQPSSPAREPSVNHLVAGLAECVDDRRLHPRGRLLRDDGVAVELVEDPLVGVFVSRRESEVGEISTNARVLVARELDVLPALQGAALAEKQVQAARVGTASVALDHIVGSPKHPLVEHTRVNAH